MKPEMELIVPFKKSDFSDDGTFLPSGKFIMELQRDWEESFHNKFNPMYANTIEGHPAAMLRLTKYMESGEETEYDFGMDLIDGEVDMDTNMEIEKFSKYQTVYAIGSQFHDNEDEPLFLIKDDRLGEEILVLKYVPDEEGDQDVNEPVPVEKVSMKS